MPIMGSRGDDGKDDGKEVSNEEKKEKQEDLVGAELEPWQPSEDWALLDSVPKFTVGSGDCTATFWEALAASSSVLAKRTAAELEKRVRVLASEQQVPPSGPQPVVLEDWVRLEDGRYTGRVTGTGGSFIWITVARAGKLASDPSTDPSYIEALDGRIYELSRANAAAAMANPPGASVAVVPPADSTNPLRSLQTLPLPMQVAALAASAALPGLIGFGLAGGFDPPPPPQPPPIVRQTKVYISKGASIPKGLSDKIASSQAPREAAPLSLDEQRQRAALRIERDKAQLEKMQVKLKEDELRLQTLQRPSAESGKEAPDGFIYIPSRTVKAAPDASSGLFPPDTR